MAEIVRMQTLSSFQTNVGRKTEPKAQRFRRDRNENGRRRQTNCLENDTATGIIFEDGDSWAAHNYSIRR